MEEEPNTEAGFILTLVLGIFICIGVIWIISTTLR